MATFTIKYKNDANIGMVCSNEALTENVEAVDNITALKDFAINLVNGGVSNVAQDSQQTILDAITNAITTFEEVLHIINSLELRDGSKEVLILEVL